MKQDQREILCASADCMTAGVDKEWSTQNRDDPEKRGRFRRQGFLPLTGCWSGVFGEGEATAEPDSSAGC